MKQPHHGLLLLIETFAMIACIMGFAWSSILVFIHDICLEYEIGSVYTAVLQSAFCLSFALATIPAEVIGRKMGERATCSFSAMLVGLSLIHI